jgi:hypothetical protein
MRMAGRGPSVRGGSVFGGVRVRRQAQARTRALCGTWDVHAHGEPPTRAATRWSLTLSITHTEAGPE